MSIILFSAFLIHFVSGSIPGCKDVAQTFAFITYDFAFVINCDPGTSSQSGSCTNPYCPAGFRATDKQCTHSGLIVPICESATASFQILPAVQTTAAGTYVSVSLIAKMADGSVSSTEYRDVYLVLRSSSLGLVRHQVTMTAGLGVFNAPGVRSTTVESISLTLEPVGDTISSSILANASATIIVTPGAGSKIKFVTSENVASYVGVTQTVQWKIYDLFGNFATSDSRTCTRSLTASDLNKLTCSPVCSSTAVSVSSGTGSFTVQSVKAQTVSVAIACASLIYDGYASVSIDFDPLTASRVAFVSAGATLSITAGSGQALGVEAYDAYGNVATGFTGSMTVSSSVCSSLGTKTVYIASGAGSVSFASTAAQTCAFQVTGTATLPFVGSEVRIQWKPAAAYGLFFTGPPSGSALSVDATLTVQAVIKDQYGNVKSDDAASRAASLTLTPVTGSTVTKAVSFASGQLSYSLVWNSLGSVVAELSSSGLVNSQQIVLVYSFGAAKSVEFESPADNTSVRAGTAVNIGLVVRDAYGNLVTTASGDLATVKSSSGSFSPSATPTFSQGRASVSFTNTAAGSRTLSLAKGASSSSLVYSDTLSVAYTPGDANGVRLNAAGPSFTVGTSIQISLTAEDVYGNSLAGVAGVDFDGTVSKDVGSNSVFISASVRSGTGAISFTQTAAVDVILKWNQGSSTVAHSQNTLILTFRAGTAVDVMFSGIPIAAVSADQVTPITAIGVDTYNNVVPFTSTPSVMISSGPCTVKSVDRSASGQLLIEVVAGAFTVWPQEVCDVKVDAFFTLGSIKFKPGMVNSVSLLQSVASSTVSVNQVVTAILADKFGNKVHPTSLTQSYSVCFTGEAGLTFLGSNCIAFGSNVEGSLSAVSFKPDIYSIFVSSSKPSLALSSPFGVTFVSVKKSQCAAFGCTILFGLRDSFRMSYTVDEEARLLVTAVDSWGNVVEDFIGSVSLTVLSGSGSLTGNGNSSPCPLVAGSCSTVTVSGTQSGGTVTLSATYMGSDATGPAGTLDVLFSYGQLVSYKFAYSSLSRSVEDTTNVEIWAVDRYNNLVESAHGSVEVYAALGNGVSALTVPLKGGKGIADLRNRVVGEVVYKLRNCTGVADSALNTSLVFEYLPGEPYNWLIAGPSIAPLDVNAGFSISMIDQYLNPLGLHYAGVSVRILIDETDTETGASSSSSLDVPVSAGEGNFQLLFSDAKKVKLTPQGFLETPYFAVFRVRVTAPELFSTIAKASVTHQAVTIDARTSELARVSCAAIQSQNITRLTEVSWLSFIDTYGSFVLTGLATNPVNAVYVYAGRIILKNLAASTEYGILCFAEDLLDPPNVTPYAQVLARILYVTTLASPAAVHSSKTSLGLILGLAIGITSILAVALMAICIVRKRNHLKLQLLQKTHAETIKLLVDDDDGTDEQLENAIGESSDILKEAERMQRDILGKIKNAENTVSVPDIVPEESSEDDQVKPARRLSEVEEMLTVLKDRRVSLTESVESTDLPDVSLEKILGYTGVGHLMFEFSKLLKELLSCHSDAEVRGIRDQWIRLIDGLATKHLPQEELEQLNSLFQFIVETAVTQRLKAVERESIIRAEIVRLSVDVFPSDIANFMDKLRADVADLEDELNFHSKTALESLSDFEEEHRSAITSEYKLKYDTSTTDEAKEKLLRDLARAIDGFNQESAASRRKILDKLAKERQESINIAKQQKRLELQQILLKQRETLQGLNFNIAALNAKGTTDTAEMEKSIDEQLMPGWSVVVEREVNGRDDDRKRRRLADVKNNLERELLQASTEEEREKLKAEAARLEAAVIHQHQADASQVHRELEYKWKERQERLNQLRHKKFSAKQASEHISNQHAEAKIIASTEANLSRLELSIQNAHALAENGIAASVDEHVASIALRSAVQAEASLLVVCGDNQKLTELELRLEKAATELKTRMKQQRELQTHLLKRMFARKELEAEKAADRLIEAQIEPVSEAVRSADVQAMKAIQTESGEVNRLLLEDALTVIDREEQQLLTSLNVAACSLKPDGTDSIIAKLQSIMDSSERMRRERAVLAECGKRRKMSEAHFAQISIQANEQVYEEMKLKTKIRELEEQQQNIKTDTFNEIAKMHRNLNPCVSDSDRQKVMQTWAEDVEAQEVQTAEQTSNQKALLLARARDRSEKLEAKKQKLVADREANKAKSSALLNRAIGALNAQKRLAAQHDLELASLRAKHKELEEEMRAQADAEMHKMEEKVRIEQDEKRKLTESKARIKRLTEAKGAKIAPEEFGAIKEERDLNVAALSQVIGEEQSVHEKVLQAKLQKRQERLIKKQQAAHLHHTQAEIRMELEIEQGRVKQFEDTGDVDALMKALERINSLVSRLNESTVAPLKAAKSMKSGLG